MGETDMPFNELEPTAGDAGSEAVDEAAWRAENLPHEQLVFRWRYADARLPLYERRIRSLAAFHVGPAVQAWVRTRLEWMQDNRLREQPEGVLELTISPAGDVGMGMRPLEQAPQLSRDALVYRDGQLAGCELAGSVWAAAADGSLDVWPGQLRHAASAFARDILQTLGHDVRTGELARERVQQADELFVVNDEFGAVPLGTPGPVGQRLAVCFEKLWSA